MSSMQSKRRKSLRQANVFGIYTDGGYAEYILVPDQRYLVKLDDKMDMDTSATLSCSALTAYGAVKNAELKPNDTAVVVGAGGLGLMAIQLAKAFIGARIIAMDIDDNKLQTAKNNGADIAVNSKNEDAAVKSVTLRRLPRQYIQLLRRRGKVVLFGLFGGELRLNLVSMPTRAYKLIGSYTGTLTDLTGLVSLTQRGVIKPVK